MALYKQAIKESEIVEINRAGNQIKIVSCEADLRLRIFGNDGGIALDTQVSAGFSVDFSKGLFATSFSKIVVQSEIEQAFKIWVSDKKLSYEAPSKGANKLVSTKVNHYGDDQLLVGFDPNRVAMSLYCESPFFVGGEGCTIDNGLPMKAGEINRIEAAAGVNVSIDIPADQKVTGSFEEYQSGVQGGQLLRYAAQKDGVIYGLPTAASHGQLAVFNGSWELNVTDLAVNSGYYSFLLIGDGFTYIDGFQKLYYRSFDGAVSQLATGLPYYRNSCVAGKFACYTGYKTAQSSDFVAVNIETGEKIAFETSNAITAMHYSSELGKFFFFGSFGALAADGEPGSWGGVEPVLTPIFESSISSTEEGRKTENKGFIVIAADNGALIINKADLSCKFDATKTTVFASRDGRVKAFSGNNFYISTNGGGTWGLVYNNTGLNLPETNRKWFVSESKGSFKVVREYGSPVVYEFIAEVEKVKPKAIIRVMGEVV